MNELLSKYSGSSQKETILYWSCHPYITFLMCLKLIFKIITVLAPSWSSVGDLAPLPIGHHHSDRGIWEKPALSLLLCRFQMLISFMSGTVENRKTYTGWKHPSKISHSFSELKNDWKKFYSARYPSHSCFWTSGHFHGLWLSWKTKLDRGPTTPLVGSHS